MTKRVISLLLTLGLLLLVTVGLGETETSLSAAKIQTLQNLAGENGAVWEEGTNPSGNMNAFQMWQWTDWFLSNRVRSLLGSIQDYAQMETATLNVQVESDQWRLRELENTLSRYEAQLEEDRLAILNGISLYRSSTTSAAERQAACERVLEAKAKSGRSSRPSAGITAPTWPR